jgi:hypothetical protein
VAMALDSVSLPSATSAAEVSSQDVSIPKISIINYKIPLLSPFFKGGG